MDTDYDPAWLVALARQQYPEEPWLAAALESCTKCSREGSVVYFVDRMEGKFKQNVFLFSADQGKVVLDLLEDGRIGAMEILSNE